MVEISTAKQHIFEIQKKPCLEVRASRPRGLGKQNDLFSPVITHIGFRIFILCKFLQRQRGDPTATKDRPSSFPVTR